MAYPAVILKALAERRPCSRCGRPARPAHVVALQPHIGVDAAARTGFRVSLRLTCPCGLMGGMDVALDRAELDAAIRELRLRANAPPSRREPEQMYIHGAPLRQRSAPRPTNRTAPDHPISDEEVAAFRERLDRVLWRVDEVSTNLLIVEFLEGFKPPPEDQQP